MFQIVPFSSRLTCLLVYPAGCRPSAPAPGGEIAAFYDPRAGQKVLSNLLSSAFIYCNLRGWGHTVPDEDGLARLCSLSLPLVPALLAASEGLVPFFLSLPHHSQEY